MGREIGLSDYIAKFVFFATVEQICSNAEKRGCMGIESSPFGCITLTGDDAIKFINQVTYGKPKNAAAKSVAQGVLLSRQMQQNGGKITIELKHGHDHVMPPDR